MKAIHPVVLQLAISTSDSTWAICPRRAGKLYKARSRLYRSQSLQVNNSTRWKALAEIYTIHFFAPFWNRMHFFAPFSILKLFVFF